MRGNFFLWKEVVPVRQIGSSPSYQEQPEKLDYTYNKMCVCKWATKGGRIWGPRSWREGLARRSALRHLPILKRQRRFQCFMLKRQKLEFMATRRRSLSKPLRLPAGTSHEKELTIEEPSQRLKSSFQSAQFLGGLSRDYLTSVLLSLCASSFSVVGKVPSHALYKVPQPPWPPLTRCH